MESRKKILIVAMQNSTHLVRWLNQIPRDEWEIHLFPTIIEAPIHPGLRNVTIHKPWYIMSMPTVKYLIKYWVVRCRDEIALFIKGLLGRKTSPSPYKKPKPHSSVLIRNPSIIDSFFYLFTGHRSVSLGPSGQKAPLALGPKMLSKVIQTIRPDLVHSMEFQHCGYNVMAARENLGNSFPVWLATNWGSDIYYFRNVEGHRETIRRLLGYIDYYSCECERDLKLARELGFNGIAMPVIPNAGGFDLTDSKNRRNTIDPSRRKLILIKGYQSFAGRALTALDAIEKIADKLIGTPIIIYSASVETRLRVKYLQSSASLDIKILDHTSHEAMLNLFSTARIYIGVSISDGISTSMLEAMAMGAFPIQTNTACCDEWIIDGESGFVISPDQPEIIADRIKRAITDDALVDRAAELNWKTVEQRLDQEKIKNMAISFYRTILNSV